MNLLDVGVKYTRSASGLLVLVLFVALAGGCASMLPSTPMEVPTTAGASESGDGSATAITAETLEDEYGIHVNLLAVTAAGGMVDLRLKIVDAAKATALLEEPANFPVLRVGDGAVTLQAPEDSRQAVLNLHDGSLVVLLYPNTNGAVTPGTAVTVVFGEMALEPIDSM